MCTATCGNGALNIGEQCDDNNLNNLDGCSNVCAIEPGYSCVGTPSVCTANCGDGIINVGETCDDTNTASGDGCSNVCAIEPGYSCVGSPSVCTSICGDGVLNAGEACDDNNVLNGDGCNNVCTIEAGWACINMPAPSVCTQNQPPVANAGLDKSYLLNSLVTLNGTGSTDDGLLSALVYSWTQISGPAAVTLSNAAATMPSFTATVSGVYLFNLTVFDGQYYSSDIVSIDVASLSDSIRITAFEIVDMTSTPITTIGQNQAFRVRVTIENKRMLDLVGITSQINPNGFPITINSDGTTSVSMVRNIPAPPATPSVTLTWVLNSGVVSGNMPISVNTQGIVNSTTLQVI